MTGPLPAVRSLLQQADSGIAAANASFDDFIHVLRTEPDPATRALHGKTALRSASEHASDALAASSAAEALALHAASPRPAATAAQAREGLALIADTFSTLLEGGGRGQLHVLPQDVASTVSATRASIRTALEAALPAGSATDGVIPEAARRLGDALDGANLLADEMSRVGSSGTAAADAALDTAALVRMELDEIVTLLGREDSALALQTATPVSRALAALDDVGETLLAAREGRGSIARVQTQAAARMADVTSDVFDALQQARPKPGPVDETVAGLFG